MTWHALITRQELEYLAPVSESTERNSAVS